MEKESTKPKPDPFKGELWSWGMPFHVPLRHARLGAKPAQGRAAENVTGRPSGRAHSAGQSVA